MDQSFKNLPFHQLQQLKHCMSLRIQEKSQALLELFPFFEAGMLSTFSLRSATLWGQEDNEGSQGVGCLRCGKVISVLRLVLLELQTQSPSPGFVSTWDRHCCA